MRLFLSLISAFLMIVAVSCSNGNDDMAFTLDVKKDALRTEMQKQIHALDERIEQMNADMKKGMQDAGEAVQDQADETAETVSNEMDDQIANLKERRDALQNKLKELKQVTDSSWNSFTEEVKAIMTDESASDSNGY